MHHQVGKRDRENNSWNSWTTWLLRPWDPQREQVSVPSKCRSQAREREFLCSSGIIIAWVGWNKCFCKMANQLPKLSHAPGGSTSQPISFFLRLDWHASLVKLLSLYHVDFYGTCTCFPLAPHPSYLVLEVGRAFLSLSNYLASILQIQWKKPPRPRHHRGWWGRLPRALSVLW